MLGQPYTCLENRVQLQWEISLCPQAKEPCLFLLLGRLTERLLKETTLVVCLGAQLSGQRKKRKEQVTPACFKALMRVQRKAYKAKRAAAAEPINTTITDPTAAFVILTQSGQVNNLSLGPANTYTKLQGLDML